MLVGGSSAFEMAHSPLALYESQESYSPNSRWKYVLDPQLSKNITKETKELLKQDSAKKVQATDPNPQFIRRIESRSTLGVSFDAEGYDEHGVPVSFESTCEAIADTGTVHAVALAYEPVFQQKFWGDINSLLDAKGVLTGRHTEMRAGKKKTKDARDGLITKVFLFFICSRLKLRFARRRITPRMITQIWPLTLPMHKRKCKT
jgi:hypothetical protein